MRLNLSILRSSILLAIPLLIAASGPTEPLDCAKFFTPATDPRFPFTWREDRCEGFVRQNTSYRPTSLKISYFGYGDLSQEGIQTIANNTDSDIELRAELESRNTYYRLVAILGPTQSINWRYPEPLRTEYGLRLDKIGMLASTPGAAEHERRPFTVSGSTALTLGIVSTDFRFNAAEVVMYGMAGSELTEACHKTYDFHHQVSPMEQQTFRLDLCDMDVADIRRISVTALLEIPGAHSLRSHNDFIWIK